MLDQRLDLKGSWTDGGGNTTRADRSCTQPRAPRVGDTCTSHVPGSRSVDARTRGSGTSSLTPRGRESKRSSHRRGRLVEGDGRDGGFDAAPSQPATRRRGARDDDAHRRRALAPGGDAVQVCHARGGRDQGEPRGGLHPKLGETSSFSARGDAASPLARASRTRAPTPRETRSNDPDHSSTRAHLRAAPSPPPRSFSSAGVVPSSPR